MTDTQSKYKIKEIFSSAYSQYCQQFSPSQVQNKAACSIMDCKSGALGVNISRCEDCGHMETHNNSCRNRHCPCCQAVLKELWIDKRKAEVIDVPYFHVVFTLPAQLNPLMYANQQTLYPLLHQCASQTLLELAKNPKYLGAAPGMIQILHTWGQKLNYHPHMHCIVTGAGLTKDKQLKKGKKKDFFLPVRVLASLFRGKFLAGIQRLYESGRLAFSSSCGQLQNSYNWKQFRNHLYEKEWAPYMKETFNGFGNAIDYLGRYTNRIAISNSRIKSVTDTHVTFSAKDYRTSLIEDITLTKVEFIRRFLMHVLPSGFQKIRYYGFLNNRYKKRNLILLSKITGKQLFQEKYAAMNTSQILLSIWGIDLSLCPKCGCHHLRHAGRTYGRSYHSRI